MRLTLRTLLAYVDDILEPAQAREIGQKIKESEVARQLLARVREVVRRRRLGSPDVEGPDAGLDPNTVAEYLDNTLTPAGVADVERVCLESDVHLAEVAACHQILTLVLGDPVEVSEASKDRVYALGPLERAPQLEIEQREKERAAAARTAAATTTKPAPAEEPFESRIPEYLRSKPTWHRFVPYALVALLAAGWFALIWYDPTLNPFHNAVGPNDPGGEQVAGTNGVGNGGAVVPNEGGTTPVPVPPPRSLDDEPVPGDPVAANDPRTNGGTPALPPGEGINPPPPDEEPGTGTTTPEPTGPEVAVVPSIPDPPVDVPEPAPADPKVVTPSDPMEPTGARLDVVYASTAGVLLSRAPRAEDVSWMVFPKRSLVRAGETLACPEPFDADLSVGRDLTVTMLGNSRMTPRKPSADARFAARLERGRFVFVRPSTEPDDPRAMLPTVCELSIHGRLYALSLDEPGTRVGVEVRIAGPTGDEQVVDLQESPSAVYLSGGKASVVPLDWPEQRDAEGKDGRRVTLPGASSGVSLTGADWPIPAVGALALSPTPVSPTLFPEWLSEESRVTSPTARRARTQFEREFDVELSIVESLGPEITDSDQAISEYAVKSLSLIGDVPAMVSALATAPHPESRAAAIEGLREWMAVHPVDVVSQTLEAELPRFFVPEAASDIARMLWGFDADDAQDELTSRQLVDGLDSTEDAVRYLSFYFVRQLTGKEYEYLPHSSLARRNASVRRWREHVQSNGALVASPTP